MKVGPDGIVVEGVDPNEDDNFKEMISFLKKNFLPADERTADLELTTMEIFELMMHHYPSCFTEIHVFDALKECGFTYGSTASNTIRFVWFLKRAGATP